MGRYPDVAELAAATKTEIDRVLHSLGLFWRTKLLISAARVIVQKYGGVVPDNVEELKSLPRVSNYITSAVRCFAFGHPEALLDTNTVRIVGRVFGENVTDSFRRSKRFEMLYRFLLDAKHAREFNYATVDLGAMLYRPKNPVCRLCPIQSMCKYGHSRKAKIIRPSYSKPWQQRSRPEKR